MLKVFKPWYVTQTSGLHWYVNDLHHHQETSAMMRARLGAGLLYRQETGILVTIVIMQMDENTTVVSERFLKVESKDSKTFLSNERQPLNI